MIGAIGSMILVAGIILALSLGRGPEDPLEGQRIGNLPLGPVLRVVAALLAGMGAWMLGVQLAPGP